MKKNNGLYRINTGEIMKKNDGLGIENIKNLNKHVSNFLFEDHGHAM